MKDEEAVSPWPIGGGVAGDMIRRYDWSTTSLGPISSWPQNLRVNVNSMVNSPIPQVLMWGADNVMLYNDGYIAIAGSYHPAALGGTVSGIWPEIWDWNRRILEEGFAGKVQSFREQTLTLHRYGRPEDAIFDLFYTPIHSDDGTRVDGVLCTVLEITTTVAARTEAADSKAALQSLMDALPILVGFLDTDLVFRLANGRYLDVFGVSPEDVVGQPKRRVVGETYFASREPWLRRALSGEMVINDAPVTLPDGNVHTFEVRYIPRRNGAGQVTGIYVLMVDVEDRKRSEMALLASNQRFEAAVRAIHGYLWTNTADGRMRGEQPGWAALTGQRPDEYHDYGWVDAVHPEDRASSLESWKNAVAARTTYTWEHRVLRKDGVWRNFAIRAVPTQNADGSIREWVGVHTDITDQRAAETKLQQHANDLERQVRHRKRAEDQLRLLNEGLELRVEAEIAERRKAEHALQQSQKMEAIGQLTGGIAHDFNNLLQVISGNLQLLARDIVGNDRAEERVGNALAGTQRGAKLASQLLAFGRRQALEPKVVHVGKLISNMDDLLRRALGEEVEIGLLAPGDLWNCCVDPNQFENMLLNLAINARDAMEGHGKLTIEVGNVVLDRAYATTNAEVEPGDYVMLAVTDTGSGMTPEVLEKVFEPFFSTKPEGKGSGLGLSMVYGFVKQSKGHVAIYSEPGQGTTVKVFLPCSRDEVDPEIVADHGPVNGGTETILVVEDDDAVRETVVEMLTELGYHTLTASDPEAGLGVIASGAPIDVLFTDVIMPGPVSSRQMAQEAQARIPDIALLFTSGYTEDSIVHGGRLDPGVELLSKPYTREALARRLRHVIANRPRLAPRIGDGPPVVAVPELAAMRVLVVEDNFLIRADTAMMVEELGHHARQAANARQALEALSTEAFDVMLTDLGLPDLPGVELAGQAIALRPELALVFATGEARLPPGSPERAVLMAKPYTQAQIAKAMADALDRQRQG